MTCDRCQRSAAAGWRLTSDRTTRKLIRVCLPCARAERRAALGRQDVDAPSPSSTPSTRRPSP